MHFGLPAVFLTITTDDQRNYCIVLYALSEASRATLPNVEMNNMNDDEIIAEFKIRQRCRTSNPGLCAEEYHRIMTLVIKHLFQWNETKINVQLAKGVLPSFLHGVLQQKNKEGKLCMAISYCLSRTGKN